MCDAEADSLFCIYLKHEPIWARPPFGQSTAQSVMASNDEPENVD